MSTQTPQKETHVLAPTPRPRFSARVEGLLEQMTLEEKQAQLVGFWVDQGDELVAPMAGEKKTSTRYEDATAHGIGHLTRVYGTRPVDPIERAQWLWGEQARLQRETRLGIPALVHEECLTGLAAWQAATFPTPLAWGASFDPELVEQVGQAIGSSMRELGIHQGLTPPSSTSSATRRRPPAATTPRCTPGGARSRTCCSRRSRWPFAKAGCAAS
ncbi:MAG: glycosyl hydrolase [Microbacterium sp.]|nr:glycosyl hydrolase [Microbacterium sp.]